MWLVAIAWIFVVGLMALVEADATSVVAGLMTFLFYCVVPLSILYYLTGSKRRARQKSAADADAGDTTADAVEALVSTDTVDSDAGDD